MNQFYTAESVTEGHPDKLCDLISDSVLDTCLTIDPNARVACEVAATRGFLVVMGEITVTPMPDICDIARAVLRQVGYDPDGFEIVSKVHLQSEDIAAAVSHPLEDVPQGADAGKAAPLGAGDQGTMIGYACCDTVDYMPAPVMAARRITNLLTLCRITGRIQDIGPDGKAQVTMEYAGEQPVRVDSVVVSVQHTASKDPRQLEKEITEHVLGRALRGFVVDEGTRFFINPSGSFVVGGPDADTGLTGRKLMVDNYGMFCSHGGGAFSGKDPTKVDRSAAYMARYIAKNIVAARLADRCQVSLTYAIGMAEPLAVSVDTFRTGTACEDQELAEAVKLCFDLTPAGIIRELDLCRPIYAATAVGGHFGRAQFPWERLDKISCLRDCVVEE